MDDNEAAAQEISVRALQAWRRQNLIGIVSYPGLWLLIVAITAVWRYAPSFVWINAAVFAATSALRLLFHRRSRRFNPAQFAALERLLIFIVLTNAAQWGLMMAWCVLAQDLAPVRIPLLLELVSMSSTGTLALAFHATLRRYFPLLMGLPGVLALMLTGDPQNWRLAALGAAMITYIVLIGRERQREYFAATRAAIQLEQRTKELEYISFTDPVTRLYNRAYFDAHFELEWKRALRQQYPLALLLIDLDHFKSINDRYGHPYGDYCLGEVGLCLTDTMQRSGDVLARIGGEEFALLLINTDEDGARVVADQICAAIRALPLQHESGQVGITTSIGIAVAVPANAEDSGAELKRQADRALYRAKHGGRDQWCCADPQPSVRAD